MSLVAKGLLLMSAVLGMSNRRDGGYCGVQVCNSRLLTFWSATVSI